MDDEERVDGPLSLRKVDAPTDQELSLMDFLEYGAALSRELAQLAEAFGQIAAARHLRLAALKLSEHGSAEAGKQ